MAHRTLGDHLASKLAAAKRKPRRTRPRIKRRAAKRPPKPRADPRAAQAERQLQQTEIGRMILRLSGDLAEAKLAEGATEIGLNDAEDTERKLLKRLGALAPLRTAEAYCSAADLQGDLLNAEIEARRWRAELAKHRGERERIEGELRYVAGYL
jgi:hypothetical protein